jgi:hypothetical protein
LEGNKAHGRIGCCSRWQRLGSSTDSSAEQSLEGDCSSQTPDKAATWKRAAARNGGLGTPSRSMPASAGGRLGISTGVLRRPRSSEIPRHLDSFGWRMALTSKDPGRCWTPHHSAAHLGERDGRDPLVASAPGAGGKRPETRQLLRRLRGREIHGDV